MAKKFLVTTALLETFKTDKDLFMLGEWCKFHSKISKIRNKISVQKEHYCLDEFKIYKNYKYISKIYEKLLIGIGQLLNKYHGKSLSKKYWRIVLGPWLGKFLHIVHERWITLKKINYKKDISETYILNILDKDLTPIDIEDFDRFWDSDIWNHFIFSKILKELAPSNIIKNKKFKFKGVKSLLKESTSNKNKKATRDYKKKFSFYRKQKIFIKDSYLGFKDEALLNFLLFSLPANPKAKNLRLKIKKKLN